MKIWSLEINAEMTQLKKGNDLIKNCFLMVRNEPYLIMNIVFTGVILLIIAYSGFFSPEKNNYPVFCIHQKLTGISCFSCGLSHSFSLILKGRVDEAYKWNIYGMRVFLFFISQLLMRVVFSFYYIKDETNRKGLINFDITGSILLFAIVFYPFFVQIFSDMF